MDGPAQVLGEVIHTLGVRAQTYRRDGEEAFTLGARVMSVLFPDGLKLQSTDDHARHHVFRMMVQKLARYSMNMEQGHEDSLIDLAGYAAHLVTIDRERKALADIPDPSVPAAQEGERVCTLPDECDECGARPGHLHTPACVARNTCRTCCVKPGERHLKACKLNGVWAP